MIPKGRQIKFSTVFFWLYGINLFLPKSKTAVSLMSFYHVGIRDAVIGSIITPLEGRSVFRPCVLIEAVNDNFIEQTEEIDIIFNTSFSGTFGTCSVQIHDNDGKYTKPHKLCL